MVEYTAQLWVTVGALVLGLALPFVAVLVLDGIVGLFQRRGVKPLAWAIVLTLAVGGGGYALWAVGVDQSAGAPFAVAARGLMQTLLFFTVPAAAVAFVIRTIRALSLIESRY